MFLLIILFEHFFVTINLLQYNHKSITIAKIRIIFDLEDFYFVKWGLSLGENILFGWRLGLFDGFLLLLLGMVLARAFVYMRIFQYF